MDIENTGSCIISGSAPRAARTLSAYAESPEKKELPINTETVPKAGKKTLTLPSLGELGKAVRGHSRRFMAAAAGLSVLAAGLGTLSTFCTVGVDYFYGGQLLCTVAAADDSAAIIGAAAQRADLLGVDEPEIQTSAKLALKKDLVDGDEAIDAILAAAPGLCRGYIVSVNGVDLFTVADKSVVDTVLKDYVNKYQQGGTAQLSAEVDVRDQIVRRDEIDLVGDIVPLLEAGGVLTVINTVDETQSQTIPYETTEISDDTLYMGDTVVETPGVEGEVNTTVESIYSNGELLSAAILSSETVAEPVTQVVRVGTKLRNALEDGFSYPLSGRLSSGFGARWGREHRGIDLAVDVGTAVSAGAWGTVITAKYNSSYGNYVQIDHGYGIVTTYAHLSSIAVSVGQVVDRGEVIAYSGNTGNSTGPHLHFEVINNGQYLNPLNYLN